MTYRPGQARAIVHFLKRPPEWLILGGPADADEAQTLRYYYPTLKCMGIEPLEEFVTYQKEHDFPGALISAALGKEVGVGSIQVNPELPRSASMVRPIGGKMREVGVVTIDNLSLIFGPFERAILWLDIEGKELDALLGAEKLFKSGGVDLVNVEVVMEERPQDILDIDTFLSFYGFKMVDERKLGPGIDRIYVNQSIK